MDGFAPLPFDATRRPQRAMRLRIVALTATLALAVTPSAASAETLTFTPEADTYVDSAKPSSTHGRSTGMSVDGKPTKQAFVRFRLSGLADRPITGVRLRVHQVDASAVGGRVSSLSDTSWSESMNWNTRPAIDGSALGSFGAVAAGRWYELELGPDAVREGLVSYAFDSSSSDGVRWATRESTNPPQLLVTVGDAPAPIVDDPPPPILDGLSQVAAVNVGSSEPTYYAAQHRLAVTASGRLLTVYGRHRSGVQLAWRDPGGSWETRSTGASADGALLAGTGTGDWPASIAVARDPGGKQHAWVVWSGPNAGGLRPVEMRRLTDLESDGGPRIGPVVSVDPAPRGAYKADIGFERAPDGRMRGCVLYSRRVSDSSYELTAVWFTGLASDTPEITDRVTLETGTSSAHYGSLAQSPAGLRAVTRAGSSGGSLRLYGHDSSAPLSTWFTGASGPAIPSGSSPTAVALENGDIMAVVETDLVNHVSIAYRFSAGGSTGTVDRQLTGIAQPTVAGSGLGVSLVGVRHSDGAIISTDYSPAAGWRSSYRLEVGSAETGGRLAWPNTLREGGGRLSLIAEGPGASSTTSSVWAFQRPF